MKTQIKKIATLLLLLCSFAFARAGFIPVITHTAACQGSDGSIRFSNLQSDGAGPFTVYVASNQTGYRYLDSTVGAGLDTFAVYGLAPGFYYLYVMQNASSSTYTTDTVTIQSVISVVPTVTEATCPASNGSISLAVSGGGGTYSYLWSNASTAPSISGLAAGQYAVTVTDINGCSRVIDTALYSNSPISVSITNNNNVCDSVLNAVVTGASGTIIYHWNTGATGSSISASIGRAYSLTVTDANGCQGYGYIYATAPGLHIDTSVQITNAGCTNNNGSITIHMANGRRPYTYLWSNSATDSINSGLGTGLYYVTVTDASGCTASNAYDVGQTSGILLDSTVSVYPDCRGHGGTIVSHAFSGVGPFSYLWSTGSTDTIITGLPVGQYSVSVTDAAGCVGVMNYYLDQTHIYAGSTINNNPGCSLANGSVTAYGYTYSVSSPSYSYLWSTGATTATISGLAVGSYEVTVTDAVSGCLDSTSVSLTTSAYTVGAYLSNVSYPACGTSTGSITAYGFNGSGSYSYLWSDGATTQTISNIPAGIYSVTVSDGTGCSATAGYTLFGHSSFQVSIQTTPTACDTSLHTGACTAIVTGSGGPYHFVWYDGRYTYPTTTPIDTTQSISGLSNGEFISLIVTDNSGCVSNSAITDSVLITFDPVCYDHITGYVFNDANGNCIHDAGEAGLNNAYVTAQSATQYYYASVDTNGFYDIQVLPGIHTVIPSYYNYGQCIAPSCNGTYTDTFPTSGLLSSGNNFAISGYSAFNLGVHPGCRPATPGSQKDYWIYYYNDGNAAANNVVVSFTYDPAITLVSTTPAYSNLNTATHTISWNVGTLTTGYSWNSVQMIFDVPSTVTLGTVLYAQAEIDPIAGDCNPADNISNISDSVAASHDPNEKVVTPDGNLSASDTVLSYTIRFQNTGNAPASRVVITDQLSANVNPLTVQRGASSAPYDFSLSGSGLLTFTFNGINLPDASHGDSSKGFVSYTVHTKPNLALGSQIDNTASIVFDVNAPIVTNTTVNIRSDYPNGIATLNAGTMSAQVVPNPAQDRAQIEFSGATGAIELQLTDALGQTILTTTVSTKSYTLDAQNLASGVYLYIARDADGNKASGKISVVK